MDEGERTELTCQFRGLQHPYTTVSWLRDGRPVQPGQVSGVTRAGRCWVPPTAVRVRLSRLRGEIINDSVHMYILSSAQQRDYRVTMRAG